MFGDFVVEGWSWWIWIIGEGRIKNRVERVGEVGDVGYMDGMSE